MKRYLIAVIIIPVLVSGLLLGCDSVPPSEPTNSELQAQVETLQEELNQLREQEKVKALKQAGTYYAILEFCAIGSSGASGIQILTADAVTNTLKASGAFWGLIKATEDPYLLSKCQPQGEWNITPCNCAQVKAYSEGKYTELMSKYYSQQYIDEQLYKLEQARQESAAQAAQAAKEEADRKAAIDNLPVTYRGIGSGRTPTFWTPSGSPNQYKLTLTPTWDGNISINWYQEDTSGTGANLITLKVNQVWRSTGISFGFPESVEAGRTYEYIFNWNESRKIVFFDITNVPADGEWEITVSQMDPTTLRPQVGITLVVEYDGEFAYQSTTGSSWGISWRGVLSGNYSKVMEHIQIPIHFRARKEDEGDNPLVLKIVYEGQVVAEDTAIGEDDEAWVYWEGPR